MRYMESISITAEDRAVIGTIELMDIDYPFNYNIGEAKMVLKTEYSTRVKQG